MTETDDPFAGTRMSLGEHLEELRRRLLVGLVAVAVAFLVAWFFRDRITDVFTWPYDRAMAMVERHWVREAERVLAEEPGRPRTDFFLTADPDDHRLRGFEKGLTWIKPGEGFLFVMKVCFYAALFVGAPVLLWQMWQFIAAGLYEREKRFVRVYFPVSLVAFVAGVLFGYFVIVPYGMYFLNRAVGLEVGRPSITMQYFLTFVSSLCLAFGAVFQLPLVLTFLGVTGILDPATMARYRGHFVVGSFVVAAVLTPPDPFTQLLMAVPLVLLYELGIWSARVAVRRHRLHLAEGGA